MFLALAESISDTRGGALLGHLRLGRSLALPSLAIARAQPVA
jgi:hypothetical protein